MKIEREQDETYRRWTVELDPWVERALVLAVLTLTGAGAAFLGPLGAALGL